MSTRLKAKETRIACLFCFGEATSPSDRAPAARSAEETVRKFDDVILNPIRERMLDTAALFDSEKLSFPSDEPRCKIDYVFVSPDIKIIAADIPPIVASDHRPHTATVEMNF